MKLIIILFLLLTYSHSSLSDTPTSMHFVRVKNMAGQEIGGRILIDVYRKAGIKADVTPMPGKRALEEARTGRKDGESVRIYSVGEKYPELVRVPTPLFDFLTMGFAHKDADVTLNKPEDLKTYRIVVTRGVQHTKNMTAGMKKVRIVESSDLLMPLIRYRRADVALTGRLNGLILIEKSGAKNIGPVGKPLKVNPLYHYLHKSHEHLVPRIDAIIKEMRASGELAKLRERYEQEYIDAINP